MAKIKPMIQQRKKGVFKSDLDWMDPTPEDAINKQTLTRNQQTRSGPTRRVPGNGSRRRAPKKHPMGIKTPSRK